MRSHINLLLPALLLFSLILTSQVLSNSSYTVAQGELFTQESAPEANSIFVPGNYSKIQDAVDAALSGYTIYVDAGTYNENVIIKKDNITVRGHSNDDTILFGNETRTGFTIQGTNISLSGFKVMNYITGILVSGARNCSITSNYVTNAKFGIWLNYADNCLVSKNYVKDCEHNIRLEFSKNNTLTKNTMQGYASYNFAVAGSSIEHYVQSIDSSNTVNGKAVQYILNANNLIITPQTYPDLGCLMVVNSSKITVANLTISNSYDAILFAYVSDSIIQNVNVVDNKAGIYLLRSPNCAILDSKIERNMFYGIISQLSPQAVITGNMIIRNTDGIYMSSNSSSIQRNTIQDNEIGLNLDSCFDNVFLYNNIINNRNQIDIIYSGKNIFDNGKEGNYWSNYTGDDMNNDAIGDTKVPHEQLDNHPLMGKYQTYQVTKGVTNYAIEIISNGNLTGLQLNQTEGTLSFEVSTTKNPSLTRITLPTELVNNASIVTVNSSQPLIKNVNSNQTHTTLYFEYSRDFNQIQIGASTISPILVAEAGPNQKTTINGIVKFDGNSSTSNLGIQSYQWNFGDGTSGTGVTASHNYKQAGNYTVTLEVTDIAGNIAADSLTVTVEQSNAIDEGLDGENFDTPTWLLALTIVVDFIAVDAIAFIFLTRRKRKKKILS